MPGPLRLLVVEDSATLAEAFLFAFEFEEGIEPVGVAPTVARALEMVESDRPDVVLMDVRLPDGSGIDTVAPVLALRPGTPVIIMTAHADHHAAFDAATSGAAGFLLKDVRITAIVAGVRHAAAGGVAVDPAVLESVLARAASNPPDTATADAPPPELSRQEGDVLGLLAEGLDQPSIADRLGLDETTVAELSATLRKRFDARSNLEAVVRAAGAGVLQKPDQGADAGIPGR